MKTRSLMMKKCRNLKNEIESRWGDSMNLLYCSHIIDKSRRSYNIYLYDQPGPERFKNGNPQKLTDVLGSMSQVGLNKSRVDDSTVQAWYIAEFFRNLNHMFGESNISHVVFVHVCSIRGRTDRHYIVEEIGEDVVLQPEWKSSSISDWWEIAQCLL